MNLLSYLRKKKSNLLETQHSVTKNIRVDSNIDIVIENHNNLFKDEEEIIKQGAKTLLENGNVETFEEGVIVFSTMIRGLNYKKTEKDENGHIKIILKDVNMEDSIIKKM